MIIFVENDQKNNDMQIGFPTDVKHVAHIGWDGPSVTSPSWVIIFFSFSIFIIMIKNIKPKTLFFLFV